MKQKITELQPRLTEHFMKLTEAGKLSHAYLFAGPAGTGKSELALFVAQTVFCTDKQAGMPCGRCSECRRIADHGFPDVVEVAPDGASIKVDQIRFLKAEFSKSGVEGTKKIFIISDAEKMTASAANSLLKFLEEPSGDVCAFLLTENANLILPTIISRCQEFELQALGFDELSEKLQQAGISKDKASLLLGLTDSLEIAIELSKDDEFATMTADVWEWFKLIMTNDLRAFVNVTMHLKQYFSDRSRQDMLLDLIVLLVRDVMLLKFEEHGRTSFAMHHDELRAFSEKISTQRACQATELVLDSRKLQAINVSFQNILETLTLKLVSCYHE
jgi:DNA polymerase III subunit delta'